MGAHLSDRISTLGSQSEGGTVECYKERGAESGGGATNATLMTVDGDGEGGGGGVGVGGKLGGGGRGGGKGGEEGTVSITMHSGSALGRCHEKGGKYGVGEWKKGNQDRLKLLSEGHGNPDRQGSRGPIRICKGGGKRGRGEGGRACTALKENSGRRGRVVKKENRLLGSK